MWMFKFFKNQNVFQSGSAYLHSYQQRIPLSLQSWQHLPMSGLLSVPILVGCISISFGFKLLFRNDYWCWAFSYELIGCTHLLVKIVLFFVQIFAFWAGEAMLEDASLCFFSVSLSCLTLTCKSSLYILNISPSLNICYKCFIIVCGLPFHLPFINHVFWRAKTLILSTSNLSSFFFYGLLSYLRNLGFT